MNKENIITCLKEVREEMTLKKAAFIILGAAVCTFRMHDTPESRYNRRRHYRAHASHRTLAWHTIGSHNADTGYHMLWDGFQILWRKVHNNIHDFNHERFGVL